MGEPDMPQQIIGWGVAIAVVVMSYLSGSDGFHLEWHVMLGLLALVFMLLYGKSATVDLADSWRP